MWSWPAVDHMTVAQRGGSTSATPDQSVSGPRVVSRSSPLIRVSLSLGFLDWVDSVKVVLHQYLGLDVLLHLYLSLRLDHLGL